MRVAVCYRDEDRLTGHRLEDDLARRLGERALRGGTGDAVDGLVAVIGPGWPETASDGDPLRRALEQALSTHTSVVPFLVGDAVRPSADDLPTSLAPLADLHVVRASDEYWPASVEAVVSRLRTERRHGFAGLAALARRRPGLSAVAAVTGIVTSVLGTLAALGVFSDDERETGSVRVAPKAASGITLGEFLAEFPGAAAPEHRVPATTEGYAYDVVVGLERAEEDRYSLRWTIRERGQNRVVPPFRNIVGERFAADNARGLHQVWVPCPSTDALPYIVKLALVNDEKVERPLTSGTSPLGSCRTVED